MGAQQTTAVMRRCVPFRDGTRLIIDKDNGAIRCVVYRLARRGDAITGISPELHKRLTGAGFLPESLPAQWVRFPVKRGNWKTAVAHALADAGEIRKTADAYKYIESMPWSGDL
jgi:hypothetical protein